LSQVQQPAIRSRSTTSGEQPQSPSRRRLFTSAAALTAFWGAASARAAPPNDVSADVDPGGLTSKLVRRITMGWTEQEAALANSLGYSGYLEYHLDYLAIPEDAALETKLAALTTLTMTQQQQYAVAASQLSNELTEAAILRAVMSKRQLFERMVEFWTDHFNIEITKEPSNMLKSVDDRDVIRAHALGTFPALLSASAHSPAMLTYLDNQHSTALAPNENYAREIMELHTLGVDGGYTQTDVYEVARCFSGWGFEGREGQPNRGNFVFNPGRHDNGSKVIFAGTPYQLNIPANGGINDGVLVINALVSHPNTARYIAWKMCRWFIGETPSQQLIDAVAATYTVTGGDIKSMLRTILQPNVLADAPPKYKRPFHLITSALRSLGANITASSGLRAHLATMGHRPFYWTSPDGYPDTLSHWGGLLLARWNFGAQATNVGISGVAIDHTVFFSGLTTAQQMADRINARLFGGEMSAFDKDRIRQYLLPDPPTTTRRRDAMGLGVGSPGFQWY
jgi:hypothetical protein